MIKNGLLFIKYETAADNVIIKWIVVNRGSWIMVSFFSFLSHDKSQDIERDVLIAYC